MSGRVAGKVAIVTGAARGMGKSHCLVLAREGADIVAVDIAKQVKGADYSTGEADELTETVKEIKALGRKAIAVKCDVTNPTEVESMVATAIKEFGKIDILVNNVGLTTLIPTLKMTVEGWDFMMNVNLKSAFLCSKYVTPHMIEKGYGKIVNIGSISGRLESASAAAYGVSKAGVHALTHILAAELAPYKINVNCVAPGITDNTGMRAVDKTYASKLGIADPKEAYRLMCEKTHLLKRDIQPEDISNVVLFLASDESRNVDGMVVYCDGGHI
jgi:NAD(P)-dependent dehydrogenase (short-subunit alcohol dehydrogenase family)